MDRFWDQHIEAAISDGVLNQRYFFMGIAMISVVLYHAYCAVPQLGVLSLFKRGYIGVDIFLFFSGLECAISFSRNSFVQYIKNRIKRIMPLYWIWAIVHLIGFCIIAQYAPKIIDIIGLFTALSYYGLGEIRANWYLSALLSLYLLLPIFFYVARWSKFFFPLSCYVGAYVTIRYFHPVWYYDAFISRIPIFILGICMASLYLDNRRLPQWAICASVCMCFAGFYLLLVNYAFLGTALLCPLIIFLLCMLPQKLNEWRPLSYIGEHSLEIFIANCWAMLLMETIKVSTYYSLVVYFILNVLLAIILISLNNRLTHVI